MKTKNIYDDHLELADPNQENCEHRKKLRVTMASSTWSAMPHPYFLSSSSVLWIEDWLRTTISIISFLIWSHVIFCWENKSSIMRTLSQCAVEMPCWIVQIKRVCFRPVWCFPDYECWNKTQLNPKFMLQQNVFTMIYFRQKLHYCDKIFVWN